MLISRSILCEPYFIGKELQKILEEEKVTDMNNISVQQQLVPVTFSNYDNKKETKNYISALILIKK